MITGSIELSLCSSISHLEAEERTNLIAMHPDKAVRVGAGILHSVISRHPNIGQRLLTLASKPSGWEPIGHGADVIAYRNGERVQKVLYRTTNMSASQQHAELDQLTTEYTTLKSSIGGITLKQEMFVGAHPFIENVTAVQVAQDFCAYDRDPRLSFFTPGSAEVQVENLAYAAAKYPNLTDGLSDVVDAANRMHKQTGYLPDTNGRENLVVGQMPTDSSPNLYLIDCRPIGPANPPVQEIILGQLGSLEQAIQQVA